MSSKTGGNGVRMKKAARKVPANLTEVSEFMAQIAGLEGKIKTICERLETKTARMKTKADAQLEPLKTEGKQLFDDISVFAEANRDSLTTAEKKSVDLAIGILGWRLRPASVEFDTDEETIVKRLEELNLHDFIRVKKEPNKEAMLAHRDKAESVSGVSFEQDEDFYIKITSGNTEIEKKKKVRKKKEKTKK